MKIFDSFEQRSGEWNSLRAGVITASECAVLLTEKGKVSASKGVDTYLSVKLAEMVVGGQLPKTGGSFAMDAGIFLEDEIFSKYNASNDPEMRKVAFCMSDDGRCGCSPDALIGDNLGVEIKCPLIQTHIKYLLAGELPPDYFAQVHFSMFVTGYPQWKFMSYHRQLKPLILTVERDEKIQAVIGEAVSNFIAKLDASWKILCEKNAGEPERNKYREDILNSETEESTDDLTP
jgi:hypothetical protein